MNNDKINKINNIMTKPIKNSHCLQVIETNKLYIHPLLNNHITIKSNNNIKLCLTSYNKEIYKDYNNEESIGLYSYFHLPINTYNLISVIYNIYNINDLNIWLDENLETISIKTLNRILYCFCISNIREIINNIDIFMNIIRKIFNYYNINYDDNTIEKILLDVIKNKNNLNIDFIENIKKYLKNEK